LSVVLREGDTLVIVAPGRASESEAPYRVPSADRTTFAAAAVALPRAFGEFSDGRGKTVLAATRRLPKLDGPSSSAWTRRGARRAPRAVSVGGPRRGCDVRGHHGRGLAWRRSVRLRHFEQLAVRDKRYKTLLEQTQEAVAVGVEGNVVYANPACVEMFGYERPLLGVPLTIFFAPGSREEVDKIVQHRDAAGRRRSCTKP